MITTFGKPKCPFSAEQLNALRKVYDIIMEQHLSGLSMNPIGTVTLHRLMDEGTTITAMQLDMWRLEASVDELRGMAGEQSNGSR